MRIELGMTGFKLWGMHFVAFRAFCAGDTQWRTRLSATDHGLVERVMGLDYAGLQVALEHLEISLAPHQWSHLRVLERAAARAMNGEQP